MRIAFLTECYDPFVNGVVVLTKLFREELQRHGHEVVVIAPEAKHHVDADPGVVRLPSVDWHPQAYPFVRPLSGADAHFPPGRFDLLHSHHPFSMGLVGERLAKQLDLPLVYTFHTLLTDYAHYVKAAPRVWCEYVALQIIRRHCAHADWITCSTNLMANWLREHDVTRPISIVAPRPTIGEPTPGARERLRAAHGIAPEQPVLLFAGRLAQEKRVDFVLRALALMPGDRDWLLMLVGGGPEEEALRRLAHELGLADRLRFTGLVPHDTIADYYSAADAFVFGSANETYGLVLLEAMGAGLPCVAVGLTGPREVVLDGETGFLAPLEESAFGAAVQRLLDEPELRARMSVSARRYAAAKAAVDTGRELEAVYQSAIAAFQSRLDSRGESAA